MHQHQLLKPSSKTRNRSIQQYHAKWIRVSQKNYDQLSRCAFDSLPCWPKTKTGNATVNEKSTATIAA